MDPRIGARSRCEVRRNLRQEVGRWTVGAQDQELRKEVCMGNVDRWPGRRGKVRRRPGRKEVCVGARAKVGARKKVRREVRQDEGGQE